MLSENYTHARAVAIVPVRCAQGDWDTDDYVATGIPIEDVRKQKKEKKKKNETSAFPPHWEEYEWSVLSMNQKSFIHGRVKTEKKETEREAAIREVGEEVDVAISPRDLHIPYGLEGYIIQILQQRNGDIPVIFDMSVFYWFLVGDQFNQLENNMKQQHRDVIRFNFEASVWHPRKNLIDFRPASKAVLELLARDKRDNSLPEVYTAN